MDLSQNTHFQSDTLSNVQPENTTEFSLVTFTLGEQVFALQIDSVVQVIPMLKLTLLPQAKDVIEGVINIHGQIVPMLSARRIFGWPTLPPQLNTPILIIRANQQVMGLIVDEMNDVVPFAADKIATADQVMPQGKKSPAVLKGVAYIGSKSVILIDTDHLLNPTQIHALRQAIETMTESKDRHRKPRQRRKNLSEAMADQFVTLASNLPPVDGQSPASGSAKTQNQEE